MYLCVALALTHTFARSEIALRFSFARTDESTFADLSLLSLILSFPRDIFLCFTSFSSIDPSSSILFTLLYFFVSPSLTVFKFLIVRLLPRSEENASSPQRHFFVFSCRFIFVAHGQLPTRLFFVISLHHLVSEQ